MFYPSVNTTHKASKHRIPEGDRDAAMHPKTSTLLPHSIDRKHAFRHAKFEVGLFISLTRKSTPKKTVALLMGNGLTIFPKRNVKTQTFCIN